jgi:hypothetical protein
MKSSVNPGCNQLTHNCSADHLMGGNRIFRKGLRPKAGSRLVGRQPPDLGLIGEWQPGGFDKRTSQGHWPD